ncbi:Chemotaxis protein CheY [Salinivirga cyanobacteriivorans]|uniref:Chemotaxis protein CheY n=1 Tax=Salinivirga cyanobacteriivorans TaxID=1307839 RepID=A0A0S2HV84_9BACT|nr:response regulator [Salinivirga cyanobacteriivorans]ALO13961.1 Chemotaxis protein CheY [Salinivirga cyanobacteriivorans]
MSDKSTILLVDDDFIFLEMLKESLVDEDKYNIVGFQSGEECLNHLHLKPEIIVLDYFLNSENPNAKNGLDVLKEIKKRDSKVKVIILSGQEDGNLVYDFVRENAANYVVKDDNAFDNIKKAIENAL